MTLDVVIATYSPDGIIRVSDMNLPVVEGVKYIVNWQKHEGAEIPAKLLRDDIKVYRTSGEGSSVNRNEGIMHANSEIVYLADDDIQIMPEAFDTIIGRFEEFPDTQLATFMMKETARKKYPLEVTELNFYLPKGYSVATYQMAFRREIFPQISFNEKFGINSGVFEAGEDELFHLTARKHRIKCRFFPDIIASHPHEATGRRKINDKKILHGMGAVITLSYPKSFFLRIPLRAWRLHKAKRCRFFRALKHLFVGSWKSKCVDV